MRERQDELPVKKSIDNAFQGQDEQTHMPAFAVTERKENRTLREKGVRVAIRRGLLQIAYYDKISM